jgi:hypothetical protein
MFYGYPSSIKGHIALDNSNIITGATESAVLKKLMERIDIKLFPSAVIVDSVTWENKVHIF